MSEIKSISRKKAAQDSRRRTAFFGISRLKEMADDFGDELGPSSKIRHIHFVNPVKLVAMCQKEIEKIDIAIETASQDLETANKDRIAIQERYDRAVRAYNAKCGDTRRLAASIIEIEASIKSKEIERQGAINSLAELTRGQKISKKALAAYARDGAKNENSKQDNIIFSLLGMRNEKQDAIKLLIEKKKALHRQLAKEGKTEKFLAEHVGTCGAALEANAEIVADLTRTLADLNSTRNDRDKDLNIIFRKSGLGDIKGLVLDVQKELEAANEELAKWKKDYQTQAVNAATVVREFNARISALNTAITAKNVLLATAQGITKDREEKIKGMEHALHVAKETGAKAGNAEIERARLAEELHAQKEINKVLRTQLERGRTDLAVLQKASGTAKEDELGRQLEGLSRNFDALMIENQQLRDGNAQLTANYDEACRQMEEMRQAVAGVEALNQEIARLNETLKFKEGVIGDGQDQITEARKELEQRDNLLNESDENLRAATAEIARLKAEALDETKFGKEHSGDETVRADIQAQGGVALVKEFGILKQELAELRATHNAQTMDATAFLNEITSFFSYLLPHMRDNGKPRVIELQKKAQKLLDTINPPREQDSGIFQPLAEETVSDGIPSRETRVLKVTRTKIPPETDTEGTGPQTYSTHKPDDTSH